MIIHYISPLGTYTNGILDYGTYGLHGLHGTYGLRGTYGL